MYIISVLLALRLLHGAQSRAEDTGEPPANDIPQAGSVIYPPENWNFESFRRMTQMRSWNDLFHPVSVEPLPLVALV